MSEYIRAVTLLGADYHESTIPRANIEGGLWKEPAGLIFQPDNNAYQPVVIGWDAIQRCGWDTGTSAAHNTGEHIFWEFAWPIALLSFGMISPVYKYVWVVYWDERIQAKVEVHFKVGNWHSEPEAEKLSRQISTGKEEYLRLQRRGTRIYSSQ